MLAYYRSADLVGAAVELMIHDLVEALNGSAQQVINNANSRKKGKRRTQDLERAREQFRFLLRIKALAVGKVTCCDIFRAPKLNPEDPWEPSENTAWVWYELQDPGFQAIADFLGMEPRELASLMLCRAAALVKSHPLKKRRGSGRKKRPSCIGSPGTS